MERASVPSLGIKLDSQKLDSSNVFLFLFFFFSFSVLKEEVLKVLCSKRRWIIDGCFKFSLSMCRSGRGDSSKKMKLTDFNILATLQNMVALKWHDSHGVSYQSSRASAF